MEHTERNGFLSKKTIKIIAAAFLFSILPVSLYAEQIPQPPYYPEITDLKSSNHLFSQYQQDVQIANRMYFRGTKPEIQFYSYTVKKGDSLISIAARCSVRQDTVATVNSIVDTSQKIEGRKILLPVCDGLFIAQKPANSFEILIASEFSSKISSGDYDSVIIGEKNFYFIPQEKFSASQRAYFLNPGMSMPLENSVLTSAYGMRVSPISGKWKMHRGIDLAAKRGSRILACREGFIKQAEFSNPVYGNYVIVRHPNGMESLYAHMDSISVEKMQNVVTGQTLGTVGMTGLATGPHLHFEISQNGATLNPENYIREPLK